MNLDTELDTACTVKIETETASENSDSKSEKKKAKRVKKQAGEQRKHEPMIYLCVECGRLMQRKSAVVTHESGLDLKCKKVYDGKVKTFNEKDEYMAKDFFDKLKEHKGNPAKWAKTVEEINTFLGH